MTGVCPRKIFARGGEFKHTGSPMACHFPSSTCMYIAPRAYERTAFGTFRRVRKRVCTQSTVHTRVTYVHIGQLRMYVRHSKLSNSASDPQNPFRIYLRNYEIVNTSCAVPVEVQPFKNRSLEREGQKRKKERKERDQKVKETFDITGLGSLL